MKVVVGFDHDDYPGAALNVSRAVHAGGCDRGIVVCGSGARRGRRRLQAPGHPRFNANFSGAERHARRLGKIDVMEGKGFGD